MDDFLSDCNMSPEQIRGLPSPKELLPVNDVRDASCFDMSTTQRQKAKVKEKLVKRKQEAEKPLCYTSDRPWDEDTHQVLMSFPRAQFFVRDKTCWPPREPGFLDLFSGRKGYARAAVEAGAPCVLWFEINDGADQDLMDPKIRLKIEKLLNGGQFHISQQLRHVLHFRGPSLQQ